MNYTRHHVPTRFQPVLAEAVRLTCGYINSLEPQDDKLNPEEMLDPKRNYGETWIDFVYEPQAGKGKDKVFGATYIDAYMGNGDDGGPSHLHIIAERDWEYREGKHTVLDTYVIKSIVHEFDTYYATAYTEEQP